MRLTWLALFLLACGDNAAPQPPTPDEYVIDCETATDAGTFASDENYSAFINKEAAGALVKDCTKAPQLTSPQAGAVLDPAAPPTISFNDTPATCKSCKPSPIRMAACNLGRQPFWRRVLKAFVLEGVAEAHCGAFTGTNYLLRLTHAGDSAPVYLSVLSVTSYTPDATIWSRKLGAHRGQTLSLTIERAIFFRGDIMDGPFVQPTPYTFMVKP